MTMATFKHILITRFNLKMPTGFDYDKSGRSTMTDSWLDNRFELFENYCLPSLKNQTNKNYTWFILFDQLTPLFYQERINAYTKELRNITPLYLPDGSYKAIRDAINNSLISTLSGQEHYVLSTRIDNDDCVHKLFIEEVQKQFREESDIFINFNNGLQFDIKKKVLLKMIYINNHFISRIEKIKPDIETVITYNHAYINEIAEVLCIENKKPMWIEIIHEKNISNQMSLSFPIFNHAKLKPFSVNSTIDKLNSVYFLLNFIKRWVLMSLLKLMKRVRVYSKLKSIKNYLINYIHYN